MTGERQERISERSLYAFNDRILRADKALDRRLRSLPKSSTPQVDHRLVNRAYDPFKDEALHVGVELSESIGLGHFEADTVALFFCQRLMSNQMVDWVAGLNPRQVSPELRQLSEERRVMDENSTRIIEQELYAKYKGFVDGREWRESFSALRDAGYAFAEVIGKKRLDVFEMRQVIAHQARLIEDTRIIGGPGQLAKGGRLLWPETWNRDNYPERLLQGFKMAWDQTIDQERRKIVIEAGTKGLPMPITIFTGVDFDTLSPDEKEKVVDRFITQTLEMCRQNPQLAQQLKGGVTLTELSVIAKHVNPKLFGLD